MGSTLPSNPREYWYVGSKQYGAEHPIRKACAAAWPYALYCAMRYLRDQDKAYDLMDAAVENIERYYERFQGKRTSTQLLYRMLSVLNRLSKQWVRKRREIPCGTLSDLDLITTTLALKPEAEQAAYVSQVLARLSDRARLVTFWRVEGFTWRQIADRLGSDHTTVRRAYQKELRALLTTISGGEGPDPT